MPDKFWPVKEALKTVSVRAVDSGGTADGGVDRSPAQTFVVTVSAVNDAPTAATDAVTALVGRPLPISVLANDSDPENDPIRIVSFTLPANGTLRREGNNLIYSTRLLVAGTDSSLHRDRRPRRNFNRTVQ